MDQDTFVAIFLKMVQGQVAMMLLHRGTQPSPEELQLMNSTDISLRELGELAHECGLDIMVNFRTGEVDG